MAKIKSVSSIVRHRIVVEKLRKSFVHLGHKPTEVPKDVKEGHFVVMAVEDDEKKRFIVPLSCLAQPFFLRLLEHSAEEYGFDHEGALTVPCQPRDLERMLNRQWVSEEEDIWVSNKTLVQSC